MSYWVKDINLASIGELQSKEALREMPGLSSLREKYKDKKPLKGVRIVGSVLVSYETANFIILLRDLGADVRWCSDSQHYSIDEACAYVASEEIPIFAKRGLSKDEYYWAFNESINFSDGQLPQYIIDDGAEFTEYFLDNKPELLKDIHCMLEQTTSGITLLKRKYLSEGDLPFAVMDINDSVTKSKFDNIYGSRESLLEGLQQSVNMQIAGKRVVVFGYGEVGKGCVQVMDGLGASVFVVEIDPIMAMQAAMEGYELIEKSNAARIGDIFITTTGCIKTIDESEIKLMKSGAVLMNMSEHDMEVNSSFFRNNKNLKKIKINENCDKYIFPDGREIYLLCDGYIVNLYAGHGHPPTVMGITFVNHTLALIEMVKNKKACKRGEINKISRILDEEAARLSCPQLRNNLSKLTSEQAQYLGVDINGPYK